MTRLRFTLAVVLLLGGVRFPAAYAQYQRPDGPTLKELAKQRGVEIGANFPTLVFGKSPNNWEDSPTIQMEQAIASDHFTIMTAGWEMFFGRVTEIALSTPNFRGLKYWGMIDRRVWGPIAERPYLFDGEGKAKPAFYAVPNAFLNGQ